MATKTAKPSSTTSASTRTKRKSTGDLPPGVDRVVKQPRLTLDSFFSPKLSVSVGPGIDGAGGDSMAKMQDVFLSAEQQKVLRMVVEEEKSVFFTGSAGTGKSLLLRAIIDALRKKHVKKGDCISVTASTGMAATNIGGMTIHSWGAISPTVTDIDNLVKCIRTAKPALQRWKNTRVLIIDEVSMVDGHLFDRLAMLAARLRKKTPKPFGGIQLVVTGDFFQLPPVTKGNEVPFFAFESEAWKTCIEHTVVLNKVFRQKDNKFVDLLNELRHGSLSESTTAAFRALSRPLDSSSTSLPPTELYPLRHEVDRSNISRLAAIKTRIFAYTARDSGSAPPERRKAVLAGMVVPEKVNLKVNAQVMLVRNVDDRRGLVNGAVGRIIGFYHALGSKAADGVVRDVAVSDNGKPIFCGGELVQIDAVSEKENQKPASAGKPVSAGGKFAEKISDEKYPLVEFLTGDGKVTVLVTRDEFRVEDNEGNVLARRIQVPLILAWAISIHKSQGQTIQRLKIDLGKVFEKGQSYVALSRAASIEGLQVLRFDPKKVIAHPKVIEWSKTLESV